MNNEFEKIECSQAGESCLHYKHPSGLEIYIMEMPGFHSCHALFGTKYGSVNTRFRINGEPDFAEVPEGIAHFLEHKLFENEDCDAFAQYAKTGASANAYTSFDRTCYLFSCSENFNASLEILLNFVQNPYFTEASVAKEQGIIGQEICMTNDEPGWRLFFNMLRGMYHAHPVKIDIAGSIESIAKIDADLLYRCYHTFYNLHNMVLSVAGNVKAEEVIAICDRLLKPCEDQKLELVFPEEPDTIVKSEVFDTLPVGSPIFALGFKLRPKKGMELVKAELCAFLALQALFGSMSDFYQEMIEKGLINSEFSVDVPFSGDGFFNATLGGESRDAGAVRDRVFEVIQDAKENGFDRESFEIVKRSMYGGLIRGCNNVESNASSMLNAFISGTRPFSEVQVFTEVTYEDSLKFLREEFDIEKTVLSVVQN